MSPTMAPTAARPVPVAAPPTAPVASVAGASLASPAAPPQAGGIASGPGTDPMATKKRGRKRLADDPRQPHPALAASTEGEATVQLDAVPADFDAEKHRPLSKKEFKSEANFLRYRADELRKRADAYETDAKNIEALGNVEDQKAAKRYLLITKEIAKLEGVLGGKVDLAALLAKVKK